MAKKNYLSTEQALQKLQRYCAYQDRCHKEVRSKLLDLGVYGEALEAVIAELVVDNFLDEERFARSFARGKFRMRQWGRKRIFRGLKIKDISDYCIRKGLSEIDETEYRTTLAGVLEKYHAGLDDNNPFERRQKTVTYALRRGFEIDLIQEIYTDLFSEK